MTPASAGSALRKARATDVRRSAEEARLDAVLSLIAPSRHMDHSGASLWNHLLGTFEILSAWGAGIDVCLAGLIHSIYSTQYFQKTLVAPARRREVAAIIGKRAERLAHTFCTLERQAIWASGLPHSPSRQRDGYNPRVSNESLRALRLIDLANELEQRRSGRPFARLAEVCTKFRSIGFVPSGLPADALAIDANSERRLVQLYAKALHAPGKCARPLLLNCIAEAPRCPEPRLLLAAADLTAGDPVAAYRNARAGLNDLRGWGAAWDTRVPRVAWELMGNQLLEAARMGAREPPAIAGQITRQLRRTSRITRR